MNSDTAVSINGMSTLEYPHGPDLLHPKDVGRLLLRCDDRPGLVAAVSAFLAGAGANIVSLDQHATQQAGGTFMQRTIFHLPGLAVARDALERDFTEQAAVPFDIDFRLTEACKPKRVAIMASKEDHCLLDLLWRNRRGELDMSVVMVIANHPDLADQVRPFGVPFIHIPATKDIREEAERRQLELLRGNVDLVVLARYMQIVTPQFLADVDCPLINIHHSFLPCLRRGRAISARQGAWRQTCWRNRTLRHRRPGRRTHHRTGRGPGRPSPQRRGPGAARCRRGTGGAVPRGVMALRGPHHPVRQPDGGVLKGRGHPFRYTSQRISLGHCSRGRSKTSWPVTHSAYQPVGGHAPSGRCSFSYS